MRKLLWLCLVASAFGQNLRFDNITWGPRGPVANASIAVCTQPANVSASPCTPLAALCATLSDVACVMPNPVAADALGNYHFYVPASAVPFTVQIFGPQVASPYVMTDQGTSSGGLGTITGSGTNGNYAGWNGPTGLTNAPATFSGNNTTFVGSMASASDGVHAGAAQLIGNTTPPSLLPNTFSLIGPNSASFTAYGIQFPSTPPTNGQVPTTGTPSGGITPITWATPSGGIAPPVNPQPGDTLRYSINGSGNWETSNFSMPLTVATAQLSASGAIGVVGYGSITGNPTLASAVTQSRIDPNLSNGVGDVITSPASTASLNTITGLNHGAATNIGTIGVGSFYRWSMKFAATATTNVRYWMGYANYNTGGGSGTENVSVMNTTSLATDTPSRGLIGFRFSAGTDTNWQAVACLPAGTCTTADTGVAIDTNVHVFEMATQPSGTSVKYFIDGGHLVTISSNVPPPNLGVASAGSTGLIFWVGDNKNTANAVSGNFYWMTLTPK